MRNLVLVLFVLAFMLPCFAQSNFGVITGIVTDTQHLVVTEAIIEITAASTGAVRHLVTNQQGRFEAPALLPDDYKLTTRARGFAVSTQLLRLEVGQRLAIDVTLNVGQVEQGVNV